MIFSYSASTAAVEAVAAAAERSATFAGYMWAEQGLIHVDTQGNDPVELDEFVSGIYTTITEWVDAGFDPLHAAAIRGYMALVEHDITAYKVTHSRMLEIATEQESQLSESPESSTSFASQSSDNNTDAKEIIHDDASSKPERRRRRAG